MVLYKESTHAHTCISPSINGGALTLLLKPHCYERRLHVYLMVCQLLWMHSKAFHECCKRCTRVLTARLSISVCLLTLFMIPEIKVNLLQHFIKHPLTLRWSVSSPRSRPKRHILWLLELFISSQGWIRFNVWLCVFALFVTVVFTALLISFTVRWCTKVTKYFPSQTTITESLKWMLAMLRLLRITGRYRSYREFPLRPSDVLPPHKIQFLISSAYFKDFLVIPNKNFV